MRKKTTLRFVAAALALLLGVPSCGRQVQERPEAEESTMIFDFDPSEYPVPLANLQRNSLVPVDGRPLRGTAWSRPFAEIDSTFRLSPLVVLVRGANLGVAAHSELLLFDTSGSFRQLRSRAEITPVVFGADALAWVDPSYLLHYELFTGGEIGETRVIPELRDWSLALLFRPYLEDMLSVVQFTGGPQRQPAKFFASRFLPAEYDARWSLEEQGMLDGAWLTASEKQIVLLKAGEVRLIDTDSGTVGEPFATGFQEFGGACLSPSDDLLVLGTDTGEESPGSYLRAFSLQGEKRWEYRLVSLGQDTPLACGTGGRVYTIDAQQLLCIEGGKLLWSQLLKSPERTMLTVARNNYVAAVNGSLLCQFDADGVRIFEQLITPQAELFDAPPALDAAGRVMVASSEALYCFQ